MIERRGLLRFALLSVVAAVVTIGLKTAAYIITGSIGLLSDALESLANLVAALVALYALWVAARPPDEEHTYGHTKAEYFSSGFEGLLIVAAAVGIVVAAVRRLIEPLPIQDPALGLLINALASVVNLAVARVLLRVGERHESITLEADAQHLMADVWTSLGVIAGVTAAVATGWHRLDPIVAIAVALNVLRSGSRLLRRSVYGLLDTSLPEETLDKIKAILDAHSGAGVRYHALRTRQAGARRFISFHILVPGNWTVQRGHDLLERIEEQIREMVPNSVVDTHLEPIEDPVSWEDT
ncbi:MAG TPA: cation diffusion facilitator family transporter, partial [Gemmatimonadales bacterium]|nr:cation diffusion facilitator family transporter [Gemmatimonadales bacterium]